MTDRQTDRQNLLQLGALAPMMSGSALQYRASMAKEGSGAESQQLPRLFLAPPAEVLGEILNKQFGSLPFMAPITRMKRKPSGYYYPTENREQVLGRRRAANAKERERVSRHGTLPHWLTWPTFLPGSSPGSGLRKVSVFLKGGPRISGGPHDPLSGPPNQNYLPDSENISKK